MKHLDSDFLINILAGKREAEHKMREIENDKLVTTTVNAQNTLRMKRQIVTRVTK